MITGSTLPVKAYNIKTVTLEGRCYIDIRLERTMEAENSPKSEESNRKVRALHPSKTEEGSWEHRGGDTATYSSEQPGEMHLI